MTKILNLIYKNLPLLLVCVFLSLNILLFSLNFEVSAQDINAFQVLPNGPRTLEGLLDLIQNLLLSIAPALAVIVMMWGGYQYFLGGIDGKTEGLKTVTNGVIGLVIVLMASAITNLVQNSFQGGTFNAAPILTFLNDTVINNLTILSVAVATVAMIWGGYKDFLSAFDAKTSGTEAVQKALFGLSVVFLAGAFANLIEGSLGGTTDVNSGLQTLIGDVSGVLTNVTGLMTTLGSVVATLVIAKGGFDYYSSSVEGKANGLETVRKGVTGLAIVLLSGAIATLIENFFGSNINNTNTSFSFANLSSQANSVLIPVITNAVDFLFLLAGVIAVLVIVYGGYQFYASTLPNQKADGVQTITNGIIGLVVVIISQPIITIIEVTLNATDPNNPPSTLEFNAQGIIFVIRSLLSDLLIPISSMVTVFFLVLAAYYWVTSNGESDKIKKASDSVRNSVIGFIVILFAVTITQLIIFFVNPNDFVDPEATASLIRNLEVWF